MTTQRHLRILSGVSILVMAAAVILPPTPQPLDYHHFADQRSFFGIPNFNDVISNLAFLLCGGAGLLFLWKIHQTPASTVFHSRNESLPYWVFFLSITAIAFGSMHYHWAPDIDHLLWDRLPIAIGIAALLSATLVERIHPAIGLMALPWLVILAVFSVLYWYWTERQGRGDLNFYIVVQFYSILLIIWINGFFPSRYRDGNAIFQVIALYGLAKVVESFDSVIFRWTADWVSGHTLKHLIAAYAAYRIVSMLRNRNLVSDRPAK